ncbi:type II secretion system protein GspC [Entomohabitans teleogrylli]|uniref:type II secretion system protein GspC n=1 Tax=Entomohabitans teleogrylli TaxID=1384589 RepID=UPI000A57368A|nr:type II secretion system protein GspC [Entomohabitans teleogrylli]
MRMEFYSRFVAPCIMFIVLLVSGQQGYVVCKAYQRAADNLDGAEPAPRPARAAQAFTLFQPAAAQNNAASETKKPLVAEVEGIVSSDEPWLSFAMIKTSAGQQSYREGEALAGYDDTWIEAINRDSVVVHYGGATQTLALKKPDYFKGVTGAEPQSAAPKRSSLESLHLDDYLVLKPYIREGHLAGYKINPKNASDFFNHSGLEKNDVVVRINAADMTQDQQAKNIIANWSKMREAQIVVRRNTHLENIRINVLNNE